jgi:hypothetical protein
MSELPGPVEGACDFLEKARCECTGGGSHRDTEHERNGSAR